MNITLRIILVSSLCGLLGAWLSYEYLTGFWWVLATGISFVGAWVLYSPKGFWSGFSLAYAHARGWRLDREWCQKKLKMIWRHAYLFGCLFMWLAIIISVPLLINEPFSASAAMGVVLNVSIFAAVCGGVLAILFLGELSEVVDDLLRYINIFTPLILLMALVPATFWVIHKTPSGIRAAGDVLSYFGKFLHRLMQLTILYVNSDARMTCAICAALGTTAGHFVGEKLMGCLIGALVGALAALISRIVVKWIPQETTTNNA